ncbi:hypothetical protein DYBT9623_00959 [Dyadobacter sp. CECT 9623]|uniref:Outer membrane protein beta-barrel domain-containing protein n=2 Tax=Dyadobacter linearis TaxID=2823330 RepID=A0ABM8ULE7_9BACT|nr:hypothetical protein DYBT9623_00959 [Dyadobacter sp. CECT 9623]
MVYQLSKSNHIWQESVSVNVTKQKHNFNCMKNKLLLIATFLVFTAGLASAQTDSTVRMFKHGMAIYAEIGLLPNNRVIRDHLSRLQIKPFENVMASLVLARRTESDKWFSEGRIILMNSTNYTTDKDQKKAYLSGIGIGTDGGPKLVNTSRWNVTIPLGVDLMLYRMNIKSNANATLGQVVSNPSSFQAVKLFTGNVNLHGGIGVDYKMNVMPKINDKVYLSAKATYHQPLLGKRKWRGENVTISDLSYLKVNQVYIQIGAVFFPKPGRDKKWGGMHGGH